MKQSFSCLRVASLALLLGFSGSALELRAQAKPKPVAPPRPAATAPAAATRAEAPSTAGLSDPKTSQAPAKDVVASPVSPSKTSEQQSTAANPVTPTPAVVQTADTGAAATPANQADYLVGPQDVLSITVWDQNDLSGKFTVETDGSFTFPLIGRVQAGSLTLRQIEAELKRRLADGYFKNPQLTVAVETYRSQRVFIVGEVRTPGTYTLTGDMSLIEALSRAGSTTPNASTEAVIVRAAEGKAATGPTLPSQADASKAIRVDLKELQSGGLAQNVALKDGDTIFVPRAETIYVFGQVKNPGAYALQTKDTTVLQALSLAGGVTDRGSTGRIKIVRIVKGEKTEIKVKLTDTVLPGDTVIVQERFF